MVARTIERRLRFMTLEDRPLPDGYPVQTEVDALRRTLDSMRVRNADIIGMSHGGMIALVFALANPERVRTLRR